MNYHPHSAFCETRHSPVLCSTYYCIRKEQEGGQGITHTLTYTLLGCHSLDLPTPLLLCLHNFSCKSRFLAGALTDADTGRRAELWEGISKDFSSVMETKTLQLTFKPEYTQTLETSSRRGRRKFNLTLFELSPRSKSCNPLRGVNG